MCQLIFILVTLFVTAHADNGVTILRCCPQGETLTKKSKCEKSGEEWKPSIVSSNLKTLLPPGSIPVFWNVQTGEPECAVKELLTMPSFLLIENGSLWREGTFLSPGQFCVSTNSAIICSDRGEENVKEDVMQEQKKKVNIKKCCGGGAVYSEQISSCVHEKQKKDTITVSTFLQNTSSYNVLNISSTYLTFGFPHCDDGYITVGKLSDNDSILQQDGSLNLPIAKMILLPKTFCLEYLQDEDRTHPTIFTCPTHIPPRVPTLEASDRHDWRFTIYPLGLFISVIFLAATLAAGCLVPNVHHMLHWKCQTCHVVCLLIGDFLLAVTQLMGDHVPPELCKTIAVLMHFFFLAAFFWLNTMCFNIWWTFRDLRPVSMDKGQEAWRLRSYQMYAWGLPTIIAGLAIIFDSIPEQNFPALLRPKFGVKSCWFYGDSEILTYFFGPIGVLLGLNLILFALTARELTCGLWKREVVKSTTERATLGRVCFKLVVVMGITWVADLISWIVGGPDYIWYLPDIINCLQGVFIFIVVGLQPQIWSALKRLWCMKQTNTTSANGNNHVSSSQDVPSLGDSLTNTNNVSIKANPAETIC